MPALHAQLYLVSVWDREEGVRKGLTYGIPQARSPACNDHAFVGEQAWLVRSEDRGRGRHFVGVLFLCDLCGKSGGC